MSQSRTDKNKIFFCYVGNERSMNSNAELWVNAQSYNNIYWLPKKPPMFLKVQENDILMLYCHGSPNNVSEEPILWLKNLKNETREVPETDKAILKSDPKATKVIIPLDVDYTPTAVLEFLQEQQLNTNHKILKLAACYSENFAKELSLLCENAFPFLTVIGYKDQLILGQGHNAGMLAGLAEPLVMKEDKKRELNEPVNWLLNEKEFRKNLHHFQTIYAEEKQQIKFRRGLQLVDEKTEQKIDLPLNNSASSHSTSARETRSSAHARTASQSYLTPNVRASILRPRRYSLDELAEFNQLAINQNDSKPTTKNANEISTNNVNIEQPDKDVTIDAPVRRRTM